MIGSATVSPCGTWRYRLDREWDSAAPVVVFVMLNPSTADAGTDDATLRACLGRARAGGFGRLRVLNLFALRATDPRELRHAPDPVGPDNDAAIAAGVSGLVPGRDRLVCAWGNGGYMGARGAGVAAMLRQAGLPLCHLGLTARGAPRHPLYVPRVRPFLSWTPGADM